MKGWISFLGAAILAVMPTLASAEGAVETQAATLTANRYVWSDQAGAQQIEQPISIIISITDQRAYIYRGETLIAASSVSTGKDGKETPTGVFGILQKEQVHHSNLYDAAPMPFMQRLTWDGVAIHAGRNPGFPASHGCIRVPTEFAKKLFAATSLGTPVLVTDQSAADGLTPPTPDEAAAAMAEAAAPSQAETAAANDAALAQR